jgi:hypothetical protein
MLLRVQNVISNLVVFGADPLGIYPKRGAYHEGAEETSNQAANS